MWRFWVDRGGTFTDIVARKPDGALVTAKLLSEDPGRYDDAAVEGVRRLMGLGPGEPPPPGSVAELRMGTTVATNALLERKGDRTLLLVTAGFADLLRIGYQTRPQLFALDVRRPELLYERVSEAPERLDAEGAVLRVLDEATVRAALEAAYADGVRAVAIAFMHAWLNPAHEVRAAEIAREVGFTQITPSHEASRLIKLVARGDTAVADAYLSPILRRYVEQVAGALDLGRGCQRLWFMQSSGGLAEWDRFHGRDAILSGPAGGVVGMARTAAAAGLDRLIGFDMGGTSTDVCHYAGAYERSFETEVAGVRMRAPMMDIHTVAAGGGSILTFREGRCQAGPESAGADPGPASYRRGGPLTVTDCNVALGRLRAERFPKVFGPGGDQPLDPDAARAAFADMAREVAAGTEAPEQSVEETAEGFLRIAVENMANAIKKISVERGHDVTRYTLACFGGAGGQHACMVADALGMKRVFLHPFSGVLSAYGMGLADLRALREAQFDAPIAEVDRAAAALDALAAEALEEIAAQGADPEASTVARRAALRYEGSHQTLEVAFGAEDEMARSFDAAHRARFGFAAPARRLVIDMLSVEAVSAGEALAPAAADPAAFAPEPEEIVAMRADGAWTDAALYDRDRLAPGAAFDGPAIVVERTATTVVEPGWRARMNALGDLILERVAARRATSAPGAEVDPVTLEVFNNLFMNIAEQMGATLANTAYSVNIKERLDFSCALFDAEGDLVANAPHVPVHLGSMSESVRTIARLNAGAMRPGDSFMLNAPFNGGTHLPDVTVITPVFDEAGAGILFYVGSRGHHADIGGRTPGSAPPDSTTIDEEGVVIDNFRLVDQGRLRDAETRALLASGRYPCRSIDQNMADLEAQIAANATGAAQVAKMIGEFGLETVQAYMRHVQDNAEELVRRVIGRLKDGRFVNRLDIGAEIVADVRVDHDRREAVLDFSDTSAQQSGNYNAPRAILDAVVLYVFRTLVGADIPLNQGCLKPLKIIAPEGSMLNPVRPAAVIAGNTEVSQSIADALFGALGALAGSQGTVNNFVWGNDRLQNYETVCGGMGAGPGHDGASAVQVHMTNTRMTDPEVLERRFPVRVETFAVRRGSGGAGRWRGGDGCVRTLRFLEDMTVTTLCGRRSTAPFGMAGGADGAPGRNAVERADGTVVELAGNDEIAVAPGDAFVMETPGGGGYGAAAASRSAGDHDA